MSIISVGQLTQEQQELLQKWGVQNFDDEIRFMDADRLKALFYHKSSGRVSLERLLYNLIWQAYGKIKNGTRDIIDGNLRSFWYADVKTPLSRLGLLAEPPPPELMEWLDEEETSISDFDLADKPPRHSTTFYLYNAMTTAFYAYVSHHFFGFHDFGFIDDSAPYRFIGSSKPEVIFFAEKIGFIRFTQEIHDAFGCTAVCLGGEPKLISAEFFMNDLSKKVNLDKTELLFLACVDYDAYGEIIARQYLKQLEYFGLKKSKIVYLITRDILTHEEIENYKYKIPINSKTVNTVVQEWIKKTGGIDGEAYGIECDVVPKDRIRERVKKAIQKEKV